MYKAGVVKIELLKSWGGDLQIGLQKIQLLDRAGCVLPVPASCLKVENASDSSEPSVLFDDHTNEESFWICRRISDEKPVELHIDMKKIHAEVESIRLWNPVGSQSVEAAKYQVSPSGRDANHAGNQGSGHDLRNEKTERSSVTPSGVHLRKEASFEVHKMAVRYVRVSTHMGPVYEGEIEKTGSGLIFLQKQDTTVRIQLESNWGHKSLIGVKAVQLLDRAGTAVNVPDTLVKVKNARNQSGPPGILSVMQKTLPTEMWVCEKDENPMEICIETKDLKAEVTAVRIVNLTGESISNAGAKGIRVFNGNTEVYKGEIQKEGTSEGIFLWKRDETVIIELHGSSNEVCKVGLTEIQLLDSAGCALPVSGKCVWAKNAEHQSNHPSVLFSGVEGTKRTGYKWSCSKQTADGSLPELHIDTEELRAEVSAIRLWGDEASPESVRVYIGRSLRPNFHKQINKSGPTEITVAKTESRSVCDCACYKSVKRVVTSTFKKYGMLVGRVPLPFIVLPILIFGGMGAGLVALDVEKNMEEIYFPKDSRALDDRQTVRDTFPDLGNVSYNAFSLSDTDEALTLLFKAKGDNILNSTVLNEIQTIVDQVKSFTVSSGAQSLNFTDFCARMGSQCVVDGEYILSPSQFQAALAAGRVTYPYWISPTGPMPLFTAIGNVRTQSGILNNATVLKISFKLLSGSEEWQDKFLTLAGGLDPVYTEVTYETPDSLSEELDKSTSGDIWLFSLTITIMLTYASIVTAGGNPVSTRGMLANSGVLAAGLGILGSMGLLSLCGVKFVNIVGVIPFLVLGIGVDDMFLLMSSWSETLGQTQLTVPARVGATFAGAGIGITITSVTDFLAFVIGTTSVFRSVTNFSLYAGVAVLFCYICNATLFGGCLAFHGRRVYSSRHFATCLKTKPREVLREDGRSPCYSICCGGAIPKQDRADESICEILPRLCLPKVILSVIPYIIIVLFLGYLAAAIYGAINLKQGLLLQTLVLPSSYYHKFLGMNDEYFPTRLPVGFIVNSKISYTGSDGQQFLYLLQQARTDSAIDSSFERCWLTSYKNSTHYDASAPQNFIQNLQSFLTARPEFVPDIVFGSGQTEITASRCFVWSEPNSDQYAQADLMVRMRDLADSSSLPVFAYHSAFVAYEQFLAVLPATLQMAGCALAVMFVVTFIFLPHPLMVFLVTLTIVMILVGIFGFMYFWDISLSSVTMIHLIMSVGFSVDFSAHVCAAYLMSLAESRQERARDAITHAAGPILNGAVSTLLGVVLLVFSDSYVFTTFFRIMSLVIVFGMLHAVLFLPAVLSLVGPQKSRGENHRVIPETSQSPLELTALNRHSSSRN